MKITLHPQWTLEKARNASNMKIAKIAQEFVEVQRQTSLIERQHNQLNLDEVESRKEALKQRQNELMFEAQSLLSERWRIHGSSGKVVKVVDLLAPKMPPISVDGLIPMFGSRMGHTVTRKEKAIFIHVVTQWLGGDLLDVGVGAESIWAPAETWPIFENEDGHLIQNTFQVPEYVFQDAAQDVSILEDFLEYLIPTEKERNYFTSLVGAKLANPALVPVACLFIASADILGADAKTDAGSGGTGRGTFFDDFLRHLFGAHNCIMTLRPEMLMAGTSESTYTTWQTDALLGTIREAAVDSSKGRTAAKEEAGAFFRSQYDPGINRTARRRAMRQNGVERPQVCWLVMQSNMRLPILLDPQSERRLWACYNGRAPTELQNQLREAAKNPAFLKAAAEWFMQRACSIAEAVAPPPSTPAKLDLLNRLESRLDKVFSLILDDNEIEVAEDVFLPLLPSPIVTWKQFERAVYYANIYVGDDFRALNPKELIAARRRFEDVTLHRTAGSKAETKALQTIARITVDNRQHHLRVMPEPDAENLLDLIYRKRPKGTDDALKVRKYWDENQAALKDIEDAITKRKPALKVV